MVLGAVPSGGGKNRGAMIACSPVALYTVDLAGNVLTWNSSAERIFVWRAAEITGKPVPIVPEAKRREFDALRKQALQTDLTEVLNAARRSADITHQLLAFVRRQTIDPKVIDLNKTVEGMLKMLRRLIGEDIDLSWRPGTGRMPIFMDPSQIDQLLVNLCANARDAIRGVGRLTIETGFACFDRDYCADHAGIMPGDFIMLAVIDDGYGMDKDTMNNSFEPFFITKSAGEGTGLGLSAVFGIVTQNDGVINVYSEPGKGATFKIYLSFHIKKTGSIRTQETAYIPAGRGETVLIVEDEPSILKLAQRILERLEYNVMAHRGVLDEGVNFIQKPFSYRDLAVKVREALKL